MRSTESRSPSGRPRSASRDRGAAGPLRARPCPAGEQALRATEEAYSGGVTGVLELLDSEKVLLDVRLGLARLRADYMKALAEMERAIGSAFPQEDGS